LARDVELQTRSELYARRVAILAICASAFFWAARTLPKSLAVDRFRSVAAELLSYEQYSSASLASMLSDQAALNLDPCDTYAQRALMLAEIPLVELSLKRGAAAEFDSHVHALELRVEQILRCNPRDSFAWLVAFNLRIIHGQLDVRTFQFLDTSYDTSPNEVWIAIRRLLAAMPFLDEAPPQTRARAASEFRLLVHNGLFDEAARSYLVASDSMRAMLMIELQEATQVERERLLRSLKSLDLVNQPSRRS
jgi:hypothetical protein